MPIFTLYRRCGWLRHVFIMFCMLEIFDGLLLTKRSWNLYILSFSHVTWVYWQFSSSKTSFNLSLVLVIDKVVMGVISPHFFWYSLKKIRKFGTSSHKFQPNFSIFCTLHTSSLQYIRLKWATNFSLFESPRLKRAPNLSKFHCTTEGDFPHHYKEKLVRKVQNIFSTN